MRDNISGPDPFAAGTGALHPDPDRAGEHCLQVLALSCDSGLAILGARHPQALMVHCRWAHLSAGLLEQVRPAAVAAPLFGPGFDAVELATWLQGAGYRGALWVLMPALPDPAMVRREIATAGPGLTVELLRQG